MDKRQALVVSIGSAAVPAETVAFVREELTRLLDLPVVVVAADQVTVVDLGPDAALRRKP